MASLPSSSFPTWAVNDDNGNRSIHVQIPPGAAIQCQRHSIISFDSRFLRLRKQNHGEKMSRGKNISMMASNAVDSKILTIENISTKKIGNVTLSSASSSVMEQSPWLNSKVAMHALEDRKSLWISKNAFLASDSSIQITNQGNHQQRSHPIDQDPISSSSLIRLTPIGRGGYVAISGLGSIQKYYLRTKSDCKAVQIEHLIAYSGSMQMSSNILPPRFVQLQGPGVIYVEMSSPLIAFEIQSELSSSHKNRSRNVHHQVRGRNQPNHGGRRILLKFVMFLSFCLTFEVLVRACQIILVKQQHSTHATDRAEEIEYYDDREGRTRWRRRVATVAAIAGGNAATETATDRHHHFDPWQDEEL